MSRVPFMNENILIDIDDDDICTITVDLKKRTLRKQAKDGWSVATTRGNKRLPGKQGLERKEIFVLNMWIYDDPDELTPDQLLEEALVAKHIDKEIRDWIGVIRDAFKGYPKKLLGRIYPEAKED